MRKKRTTSTNLSELLHNNVKSMTSAEVDLLRAELTRTLPKYIDASVKRAKQRAQELERVERERGDG